MNSIPTLYFAVMNDPILWYVIVWYVVALVPFGYWLYRAERSGELQAGLNPICLYFVGPLVLPVALVVCASLAPLFLVSKGFAWYFARDEADFQESERSA